MSCNITFPLYICAYKMQSKSAPYKRVNFRFALLHERIKNIQVKTYVCHCRACFKSERQTDLGKEVIADVFAECFDCYKLVAAVISLEKAHPDLTAGNKIYFLCRFLC